jgi:ComF family protein
VVDPCLRAHDRSMVFRRLLLESLNLAARTGRLVEHILVPNSCVFCGDNLPPAARPVCAGCHADLPWVQPRFHLAPFTMALAPLAYAFPVDAAIKRFKFQRKLFYAPAFCGLLDTVVDELPDDIDGFLPMPLHWRRQALRGFNQAAEISRRIGRIPGLACVRGVRRIRATPYQSGLTAPQRRRNLRNAFRAEQAPGCRHVLVVDDVITTGETCRQLARVLLDAGVERVSALAIARAERG